VDHALPLGRLSRAFVYRFNKTYESKYYPGFIKIDLSARLKKAGLNITDQRSLLGGGGVIIKASVIK
jgi:hypothetical protein